MKIRNIVLTVLAINLSPNEIKTKEWKTHRLMRRMLEADQSGTVHRIINGYGGLYNQMTNKVLNKYYESTQLMSFIACYVEGT